MKPPNFPANEQQRIDALHRLDILDTDPEERFDRITRLVRKTLKVQIVLVCLVDTDRQWFKSRQGLEASETPRNISFCGHAILDDQIFHISDALDDPRFSDNPLVTGPPNIRFYAGVPLSIEDSQRIGTLCVIDSKPRTLDSEEFSTLRDLADFVVEELNRQNLHLLTAELQGREARIRAILETVVDGIVTIDAAGMIETFNTSAERIFEYTADEVVGENVKLLMPAPYRDAHDGYLHSYLATGDARVIGIGREVTGRRKNGTTFPMELAVNEMAVSEQRMFTGIVRDITHRKAVDRMKNEFISTVNHELRTPLTSIKGSLGLLQGGVLGALPAAARGMIDVALDNTDRLVRLINDMLDIEKIEAGKMEFRTESIRLTWLIEQTLKATHGYAAEHNIRFEVTDPAIDAEVEGDVDRLTQVLTNLLSNAAKFSPEGGVVEISVAHDAGRVRVMVTDHGAGIPEAYRERIFDRFSQADSSDTRENGGTGLGLYISKAIVEHHGGMIGFESEEGVGSNFYFELPARGNTVTGMSG